MRSNLHATAFHNHFTVCRLYPNSAGNHYVAHDRSPSFLQMYVTMRMVNWMFFPRMYGFYGAGYGYGFYRPMGVPVMMDWLPAAPRQSQRWSSVRRNTIFGGGAADIVSVWVRRKPVRSKSARGRARVMGAGSWELGAGSWALGAGR